QKRKRVRRSVRIAPVPKESPSVSSWSSSCSLSLGRFSPRVSRPLNRSDDPRIRPAPANIAIHEVDDLFARRLPVPIQERYSRHDHSRCAIGALHGPLFQERFLDRMESITSSQPLDRSDRLASHSRGPCDAGTLRLSVDQYCAGPTLSLSAPILRSR